MGDLPVESLTVSAIYRHYAEQSEERRPYLGASELGEECRRALWYGFRWVARPNFPGRIKRLFETGHREEERILDNLRAIGVRIEGTQEEITFAQGHGKGHCDAVVLGLPDAPKTWHLLEIKTANKTRYNEAIKKGPPEKHAVQMQIYMGELGLTRAAYFMQCKDDDRLHLERVEYDKKAHEAALRKANTIVQGEGLPGRIAKDRTFYKCKMCRWQMMCWDEVVPDVNCRTCSSGRPGGNGEWVCELGGCQEYSQHLFIPSLLWWMKVTDRGPGWIRYGDTVTNVAKGVETSFPAATSFQLQRGDWIPF